MPDAPLLITPGDSLVARVDDIIVFAEGPAEHLQSLSDRLAQILPTTGWFGLVRHLASSISAASFDHPPVACIQLLADEAKAFVFGNLSIEVETSLSRETISGIAMTTWRESSVAGHVLSLSGGRSNHGNAFVGVLDRGIIHGGGFTLTVERASVATPSQVQVSPVAEPSEDPAVDTVMVDPAPAPPNAASFQPAFGSEARVDVAGSGDHDGSPKTPSDAPGDHPALLAGHPSADHLRTDQPDYGSDARISDHPAYTSPEFDSKETTAITGPDPHEGSPTLGRAELRGVKCPNGHLASIQDLVCRTCSAPVDQHGVIVSGPRPLLGVLEFDDGVRIPLDRPVVIGRQPPEGYRINGEFAYVVPITDAEGRISRVHVEVHLIGWDIELIDKNSVNGTFTSTDIESTSRTRLRSEQPTRINLGTIVYVGDRVFRVSTAIHA